MSGGHTRRIEHLPLIPSTPPPQSPPPTPSIPSPSPPPANPSFSVSAGDGGREWSPMPKLHGAVVESWPIAGAFVIARGAKREATVVVAQVSDGKVAGRGECVPYARCGETVAGVRDAILAMRASCPIGRACCRRCRRAPRAMRSTARCGTTRRSVRHSAAALAGWPARPRHGLHDQPRLPPRRCRQAAAVAARTMPLLKLKLGGAGDAVRLRQVRAACPAARLDRRCQRPGRPISMRSLAAAAETASS